jgi:hypothetical protein
VSAENTSTGVVSTAKTNAAGVYLFAALQPGAYRVRVEHSGFQTFVYDNLLLEVGAQVTVNASLKLGTTSERVVVEALAEQLETSTSTVGTVVKTRELLDLPLVGRNAYDLITTQAGASPSGQNFNGMRAGSINITVDGVQARDNYLDQITFSTRAATISVDRIAEFRMVTSPADAEYGRGAGQIQSISRSGTNRFHGSLYEEHRNTSLNANTWFNNQLGVDPRTGQAIAPRNFLIRNQFGGRVGGPIIKNRTFFNFNYEGSRQASRNATTSVVYTAPARQGIFRYFPGVRNGNALAAVPTVDTNGNPVRPAGATDVLQSVSLFGKDPNRLTADPSGIIGKIIGEMPLPNTYLVGDGLNTAGYTFQQKSPITYNEWDFRIDHNFSAAHRLNFSFAHQHTNEVNTSGNPAWPSLPVGSTPYGSNISSLAFTSIFRPNLLNEFRAGVFRPRQTVNSLWGADGSALPHTAGGQPEVLNFTTITPPFPYNLYGQTDQQDRISPIYQYGDTITWLKGRHSFKGGGEVRFNSYAGFDNYVNPPRVSLGQSAGVPVQGISAVPGIGVNLAAAQTILAELAGSVNAYFQVLNSNGGAHPEYIPGLTRYRHLRQPEISGFFKDDFRVNSRLTLNLGVRYERYSVPEEINGLGIGLVGGGAGAFGLSGSSLADLFHPGVINGQLTQLQAIGPKTPNPDKHIYADNNHDFAPAVGLSWALQPKTVLRTGYSIGYIRNPMYLVESLVNGVGFSSTPVYLPSTLVNVGTTPLPAPASSQPLATVPLTDRSQPLYGFNSNLKDGYYQNWNFGLQRSLTKSTVLEARYVGSKGSRLVRSASINEVNIFENGILDAFNVTRAGGSAALLNKIFNGIGGVNGTTVTGSDFMRSNATLASYLANNNPGAFALFLHQNAPPGGQVGDYLRRAGLPENFVVANPQFGPQDYYISNFGNSTYHALQVDLTKRFSSGWVLQGNYTFSKSLGDEEGNESGMRTTYRTLRNTNLDKKLLSYGRAHAFHVSGIYELPFGPGKAIGRNVHGVVARVLGGWQAGWIGTIYSGQPIDLAAVNAFNLIQSFNANPGTPVAAMALPNNMGAVTKTGTGVVYFAGLHQVADPSIAAIATPAIRNQSTMLALADSSGRIVLQNPVPGQFGTLAPNFLTGPRIYRFDVNLLKRIRIAEGKEFILRCDAQNVSNTPEFANPNTDINTPTFGRITDIVAGSNRLVVVGARFNF